MTSIYEEHPILHHYTSFSGLEGILTSKSLWATHYKALNDFSETEQMRGLLEKMTFEIIHPNMRNRYTSSLKYKRYLNKHGGLRNCAKKEAKTIVNIFYDITFHGRETRDLGPYAEPYIVSFCAHTNHTEYVKNNGLLSMWRAYGNVGGFALEFDTKKLWDALCLDPLQFGYTAFSLSDVIYENDDTDFDTEFEELNEALKDVLERIAESASETAIGEIFQPFFTSVTRFKHQGFFEESEVRLVAAPLSEKLREAVMKEAGAIEKYDNLKLPAKEILTRQKQGTNANYIVLNAADTEGNLPIRRIIVGPQENQDEAIEKVRAIAGDKLKIVKSETPFIDLG